MDTAWHEIQGTDSIRIVRRQNSTKQKGRIDMKTETQVKQSVAPRAAVGVLVMAMFALGISGAFSQSPNGGKRGLDTMTVNLYVGGDAGRVLALNPDDPDYLNHLVATVTGVYYEIVQSQPQVRMEGVADQIAARLPDIVAVQEASLIRNQSPGDLVFGGTNPATNVVFDYLQILVDKLQARGLHYAVASFTDEMDVELPMFNLQTGTIDDARLTDRDAILVRTDLPPGQLQVFNPQGGHFNHVIQIGSLGIAVNRGWCSVDVFVRGERFRYICAHLEEETAPQLQFVQAEELLAGPVATDLPVVIAGDLNADSLGRNGTTTYPLLAASGFTDTWAALHGNDVAGGLTWGHDEFLADPTMPFSWRIDYVFVRGADFNPVATDAIDLWLNRATPPLWATDHAAVHASIRFQP
jgi:endonuclease/exonuclease/phosphatase family metal-dependent hydrolase